MNGHWPPKNNSDDFPPFVAIHLKFHHLPLDSCWIVCVPKNLSFFSIHMSFRVCIPILPVLSHQLKYVSPKALSSHLIPRIPSLHTYAQSLLSFKFSLYFPF